MKVGLSILIAVTAILMMLFGVAMIGGSQDRTGTYVLVFGFIFLVIGAIFANRHRPPS